LSFAGDLALYVVNLPHLVHLERLHTHTAAQLVQRYWTIP
jgi:hypothetical protein